MGIAEYKKKVWSLFSQYIILRDCLETTHSTDKAYCCTCGKITLRGDLQAGHFTAGRGNSYLFYEKGVHAQCVVCNTYLDGNVEMYEAFILRKYGQEELDYQKRLRWETKKYTMEELKELYACIERKLLDLTT